MSEAADEVAVPLPKAVPEVVPSEAEVVSLVGADAGAVSAEAFEEEHQLGAEHADVVLAEALPVPVNAPPFDGPEPVPVVEAMPEAQPASPALPAPTPKARCGLRVPGAIAKAFFAPIAAVSDEVACEVVGRSLHTICVDPAHVAMIEATIPIGPNVPTIEGKFGLPLEKLMERFKPAKAKDNVEIVFDDGLEKANWTGYAEVAIGCLRQSFALVDPSGLTVPKAPRLDLPARLEVATKDLVAAVKAASQVSDHIRLTADPEGFHAKADGDTDTGAVDWPRSLLAAHAVPEKVSSLFSLDYLEAILRTVKVSTVQVELGTDFPMRLRWGFPGVGEEYGVHYLLAPRIESS